MRTMLLAATLAACAAVQPALAEADSEFQITPRIGQGELKLDAFAGDEELHETDTYGLGVGFGVKTPIGVLFEVGGDSQGNIEIFDDDEEFSLTQRYIAVGYQFELGEGWRFVPMVGRVRWRLEGEQGAFLNPGPEEVEVMRGYDYYWEASVSRRISRVVALGIAYKQGDYTFGKSSSAAFMVTIGL